MRKRRRVGQWEKEREREGGGLEVLDQRRLEKRRRRIRAIL